MPYLGCSFVQGPSDSAENPSAGRITETRVCRRIRTSGPASTSRWPWYRRNVTREGYFRLAAGTERLKAANTPRPPSPPLCGVADA
jgi:hypothetical protein